MREFESVSAKIKALDKKLKSESEAFERVKQDYKRAHFYCHNIQKEIENLKTGSLQNWVLKLFNKHDGRVAKEKQEQIKAKVELDLAKRIVDKTDNHLKELREELALKKEKLKALRQDLADDPVFQQTSRNELEKREQWMREVFEMDEAFKVGKKVLRAIKNVLSDLDSADSWAIADIFLGDSLIVGMAKYNKIDDAEEEVIYIESLLSQYQDELDDISDDFLIEYESITSSHRIVDLFFDNLFTDFSTKKNIQNNIDVLEELRNNIRKMQQNLAGNIRELEEKIELSFQLFE